MVTHHMLKLQLSPQRPAVWRLALAALAVNDRAPVHDGEHALQCTVGLCYVRKAHLQTAAAAAVAFKCAAVHFLPWQCQGSSSANGSSSSNHSR
jgi:hypothetical protein